MRSDPTSRLKTNQTKKYANITHAKSMFYFLELPHFSIIKKPEYEYLG